MKKRMIPGVLIAVAVAWSPIVSADGMCKPTLCNGTPPTFLTASLPTVPIGNEVVVQLRIRGNSGGTYYPYTDPTSRADDARVVHVDLDIDSPTRGEAQKLVIVRFGKCTVSGPVHTCYLSLRGMAPGATMLGLKVFDQCVNQHCPGESQRLPLHLTYATRAFPLRVGS